MVEPTPADSGSSYVLIGSQAVISPSCNRPVTITPLTGAQQALLRQKQVPGVVPRQTEVCIKKTLLNTSKGKGKDFKVFTLRDINPKKIASCKDLIDLIRTQINDDVTSTSFEVGFMQNNSAVTIRSSEDLSDIWSQMLKGKSIMLWCDGMISKENGRRRPDDDFDDDITDQQQTKKRKRKDTIREDQVEEIIQSLKAKHNAAYTQMQYRVWSEMIAGGVHMSQDEPPSTTMFARCGGSVSVKKKSSSDVVVQAIGKLSDVLSPKSSNCQVASSHSPNKVIESRSKCYRQLTELKSLKSSGTITENEKP